MESSKEPPKERLLWNASRVPPDEGRYPNSSLRSCSLFKDRLINGSGTVEFHLLVKFLKPYSPRMTSSHWNSFSSFLAVSFGEGDLLSFGQDC